MYRYNNCVIYKWKIELDISLWVQICHTLQGLPTSENERNGCKVSLLKWLGKILTNFEPTQGHMLSNQRLRIYYQKYDG